MPWLLSQALCSGSSDQPHSGSLWKSHPLISVASSTLFREGEGRRLFGISSFSPLPLISASLLVSPISVISGAHYLGPEY